MYKTTKLDVQNYFYERIITWKSRCLTRPRFGIWPGLIFPPPTPHHPSHSTLHTLRSPIFKKCCVKGTFLKRRETTSSIWLACLFPILAWLHYEKMPEIAFLQDFQYRNHKNALSHGMATVQQYGVIWKITVLETNIFPLSNDLK